MSSLNHELNETHKQYLLVLANIYLKNNQLEKVITIYKVLWHLYPDTETIAFCLGYLYLNTGQFDSALFYTDLYLTKKHSDLGFFLKSQILLKLDRPYEAKEAVSHFLT